MGGRNDTYNPKVRKNDDTKSHRTSSETEKAKDRARYLRKRY